MKSEKDKAMNGMMQNVKTVMGDPDGNKGGMEAAVNIFLMIPKASKVVKACKSIRIADNLTMVDMAQVLRIPYWTYVKYENGTRTPTRYSAEILFRNLKEYSESKFEDATQPSVEACVLEEFINNGLLDEETCDEVASSLGLEWRKSK